MTLHVPQWLQPQSGDADIDYSGFELRNYNESIIRRANGFNGERGVLPSTATLLGFAVAQRGAGANFSVDIASGRAVINDADVTNGGVAYVWSDATFNLATPSPPASGTNLHRVILQLRNKLENGTYTTYDFTPVLVADTSVGGSGTFPAEPTSAITLAKVSIASGQSNVSNANITDYREQAGPVSAYKTADTNRASSTSLTADPALQLDNLASNAIYKVEGNIFYVGGTGTSEGDLQWGWNSTGAAMIYQAFYRTIASGLGDGGSYTDSDVVNGAQTAGGSTFLGVTLKGTIDTANAPCSMIFKWAQSSSNSTATTVRAGSYLRAVRLS